jgi:hypothetical protein
MTLDSPVAGGVTPDSTADGAAGVAWVAGEGVVAAGVALVAGEGVVAAGVAFVAGLATGGAEGDAGDPVSVLEI